MTDLVDEFIYVAECGPLRRFPKSECSKEQISMEKNLDITFTPEKIHFTERCIQISDSHMGKYRIPYRELVLAGIIVFDKESGYRFEPEITEITEEMDGELYFCNSGNCCFRVRTECLGRTAGSLISELGRRAPYILIGKQTWFDPDDKESFEEVGNMVRLMRGCG